MPFVTRKPTRLPDYDYSQCGSYFVTFCTHDHKNRFWVDYDVPQLTHAGTVVQTAIRQIPKFYPNVVLNHYVVMPNHVHILLTLEEGENRKKLQTIIGQTKRWVTKQIGGPVWQSGFNDHIIRDDNDFAVRWDYIETNPLRWLSDEFY